MRGAQGKGRCRIRGLGVRTEALFGAGSRGKPRRGEITRSTVLCLGAMDTSISEEQLKQALKAAFLEVLQERSDLLR